MLLFFILDVEHWIESDAEIDEDILVEDFYIPPPEMKLEPAQGTVRVDNSTIRWIIMLVSVFQTQYYLTNRALSWLLSIFSDDTHQK